ncbi:hypothetical protein ULMS_12780 [Patiriisocius marinistellae]|uniref:HYR domain-containing protein n=1 Tax=Patiriisocius marinistellae TaxID=2494560 RepID=A0A5J4FV04_9FLAO|nr:HYR domain-containing protein [Patiriisocius marinistellae]GEQ85770.1 hypothetical protein ULMS_12780 [Patiriisocius marinistellae]
MKKTILFYTLLLPFLTVLGQINDDHRNSSLLKNTINKNVDLDLFTKSVLNGTTGDDAFIISEIANSLIVTMNGNEVLMQSIENTTSLTINGGNGDDSVVINFTDTNFSFPITFNGQRQATTKGDYLAIRGTFLNQIITHTPPGLDGNNGHLDLDGVVINFTGLEPISAGDAANTIINLPNGVNNNATVRNSINPGEIEIIDNGATFEDTIIPNPTTSLTINGGDMNDEILVRNLDIAFDANFTINGGGQIDEVTFQSFTPVNIGTGDYLINAQIIIVDGPVITSGAGKIDFNAIRNIIAFSTSSITTSNGNITLNANTSGTFIGPDTNAIIIDGGLVNSAAGTIMMTGVATGNGISNNNHGINLTNNALIETIGSGSISLNGSGGSGIESNYGVNISNSVVKSNGGGVSVNGIGGNGTDIGSVGVALINMSMIEDTSSGTVVISGQGSTGTNFNYGILMNDSFIQSNSAETRINGTGGMGTNSNNGIYLNGSSIQSNGGGITANGAAVNNSGSSNRGVFLDNQSVMKDLLLGEILITGQGGNGNGDNQGFYVRNSVVETNGGGIIVNATAGNGTGSGNKGIYLSNLSKMEDLSEGEILINGQGGTGIEENTGVHIENSSIQTNGGGSNINGTGGNGTIDENQGVAILNAAKVIELSTGTISINGQGGIGDEFNRGIQIEGANVDVISNGGDINILGSGNLAAFGYFNIGVSIRNLAQISTINNGSININGTGGSGIDFNYGLEVLNLGTVVSAVNGNIILNGLATSSTGGFSGGCYFNSEITTLGTGNITIFGTAGNANGPGISLRNDDALIDAGGDIIMTAITGPLVTPNGIPPSSLVVGNSFTFNGEMRPGLNPTSLAQFPINAAVAISSGDIFTVNVAGETVGGLDYDQLLITGTVDITDATLNLVDNIFMPISQASTITIIDNDGVDPVIGTFSGFPEAAEFTFNAQQLIISYTGGDGNDVVLYVDSLPTAICQDITVPLDVNGNVSIVPSQIDNGSSDPDGPVTLSIDMDMFSCAEIGPNTVTLTVTDSRGNTDTCTSTVTVEDVTPPTIVCPGNQAESLDGSGTFTIPDYTGLAITNDNCTVVSVTQSPLPGTVIGLGPITITLTASDGTNTADCTFILMITDDTPPMIACPAEQMGTVDENCMFALPDYTSLATATDNSGIVTVSQSPTPGTMVGVGTTLITLTADDGGNTADCTFDVVVSDTIPPTILCPADLAESADGSGTFTLPDYTSLAITNDNCMVVSVTQSPLPGAVIGLGTTTITLTASDGTNTTDCTFIITITDDTPPVIACPADQLGTVDINCMFALPDYTSLATVTDNSGIVTVSQSPIPGTMVSTGITIVTLTADDGNNTADCTFDVIVSDTIPPTILCPADQGVSANGTGTFTLPDYTGLAITNDNCMVVSVMQMPTAGSVIGLGATVITLTVSDGTNTADCIFTVNVTDDEPPMITCPADQVGNVDTNCMFALPDYTSLATATDNSGVVTITQSPIAGTMVSTGLTIVTLTADDGNSTADCAFNVTVSDAIPPTIICPADQAESADSLGVFTLLDYTGLATTNDNCMVVSVTQMPVPGTVIGLGTSIITLTVSDGTNTADCTFNITITDDTPPMISCPANQVGEVDANCMFTLPDYTSLATTSDNGGIVTVTQSPIAGTMISTGVTIVTLTADDGNSNTANCAFNVTVIDTTAPMAMCVAPFSISLDNFGMANISEVDINNGSIDNCSIASISIDITSFTCADIGDNTVTLTVIDSSGLMSSCSTIVTVEDTVAPSINCPADQVGSVDGNCEFLVPDYTMLATVTDNCLSALSISQDPAPGAILTQGTTVVTIFADDGTNISSCIFNLNVIDDIAPTVACPGDQTESTDASCSFTIPDYSGLVMASDNCANPVSLTQSPAPGTIVNTGISIITIIAFDGTNSSSCTFNVNVIDDIAPTVLCPANQTESADTNCEFVIPDYSGLATASDNCANPVALTQTPAPGTIVSIGVTQITIFADDGTNTSSCNFDLNIIDDIAPTITCPSNQTESADSTCSFIIPDYSGLATAFDNCANPVTLTQSPATGTTVSIGITQITLFADDGTNISSCVFDLNIIDNIAPTIMCPGDQTESVDATCSFVVPDYSGLVTASDNCANPVSLTQSPAPGTIVGTGITLVTVSAFDGTNTTDCTFNITVIDDIAPVIICPLDQNESADTNCEFVVPDYTGFATTTDNCGVNSIIQTPVAGTIVSVGITNIELVVSDGTNTENCQFILTVTDDTAPTLSCPGNQTESAVANCEFIIPDYTPLVSATDNCGTVTVTQIPAAGTTVLVGTTIITMTASDGINSDSCTFDLNVVEATPPIAICQNITVILDATGTATISAADVDNGSNDNCGNVTTTINIDTFDCEDLGTNEVILTVEDDNGNIATCTAIVTIVDETAPEALCNNITVELDGNGMAVIEASDIDGGSTDACGIVSFEIEVSQTIFDCSNIGENIVTLTVTDTSGNQATCDATVTIIGTTGAVAICQNVTAPLGQDGTVTIPAISVYGGTLDISCPENVFSLDIDTFTCDDIGPPVPVILTAIDNDGNITTCQAFVNVVDSLEPMIICPDNHTVTSTGPYALPDYFATGEAIAMDNCTDPVTVFDQDPSPGTPLEQGTHIITLSAQDNSNFEVECEFVLIVDDLLGTNNTELSVATIVMYPNPASNVVMISNPQLVIIDQISIYDITGRLVLLQTEVHEERTTLDISTLQGATYVVIINTELGDVIKQLVVE